MHRTNESIAKFEENRQLKQHSDRHARAIKLEFDLPDLNLELLNAIYAPRVIQPSPGRPCPTHPIAAAQQRVAQQEAYAWAKTRISSGLIEIGPNVTAFSEIAIDNNYKTTHGCCKPDGRDEERFHTSAWSRKLRTCRDPRYRQDVAQLQLRQTTPKFCTNGFQNCFSRAVHAIAVHSLYDITLAELALGFYNHGLEQLRAWMHLPYEMLQVDQWTNRTYQYQFTTYVKDGKKRVRFGFLNDPSFKYEHDYETWTAYMTQGTHNTPYGFGLLIEIMDQHGTQASLRITKTSLQTSVVHSVPSGLVKIVAVPNLMALARKKFCSKAEVEYIHTDAVKVNKLTDFLLARDNKGFNFNTCLAYARSLRYQVKVGAVIYEESWETGHDFEELCISLFLLTVFQRKKNEACLTLAFDHMSKSDHKSGMFKQILKTCWETVFPMHLHEIRELLFTPQNGTLAGEESRNHFCKLALRYYDDLEYANESVHHHYTITPAEVPILETEPELFFDSPKSKPKLNGVTPKWIAQLGFDTGVVNHEPISQLWKETDHQQALIEALDKSNLDPDVPEQLKTAFQGAIRAVPTGDANDPNWDNVVLITGPPGCGKSSAIRDKLFPTLAAEKKTVLYITPSRELRNEMRTRIHNSCVFVHTIHTGMSYAVMNRPDYIIIDECFTFPTAILAWFTSLPSIPRLFFLGDPMQIQFIDFENCWFDDIKLEKFSAHLQHHRMSTTYRSPVDVANLALMQEAYPGLKSNSQVKQSILFIKDEPALYHKEGFQHIVLTQASKTYYNETLKYPTITAHESIGRTFDNVILHYNGNHADSSLLKKSPHHLIVAITRHTEKLVICDETENEIVTILNDTTKVSIPLTLSNIDVQAMPDRDDRPPLCITEHIHEERVPYAISNSDAKGAANVLQNAFPMQPLKEYQAIVRTDVPEINAKATFRPAMLGKDEEREIKKHTVYSFPEPQRNKVTRSTDQRQSLISMAKRQGKHTKNLIPIKLRTEAIRLFNKVEREFDWEISDEHLKLCYLDAVTKFTARGHSNKDLLDITDWNDQSASDVKNFLKKQEKPSTTVDPLTKEKGGQGISAWSKTLNFQVTIWTRLLEYIMTRQSKGKVIIAAGFTDEQMMTLLEERHVKGTPAFENDWSEFDSSQNNLTHAILASALQHIGMPSHVLQPFLLQLASRRVCDTFLTIQVEGKKDSGAPHTLIDNCLFNLAIHLDILTEFETLLIKGDDVIAFGLLMKINKLLMEKYFNECGYQFKPSLSCSAGFVSFIVNDIGSALDFPRIASKVLSRNYTSIEDYVNYQEAIAVTLRIIPLEVGINMTKVNAMHHNINYKTNVTESDMDILLSFLFKFSEGRIPFTELISRESSTLFCELPDLRTNVFRLTSAPARHKYFQNIALNVVSSLF